MSKETFQRSYRLLSPGRALLFPLAGAGVTLLLYVSVGSVEPSFELRCDRATCVVRESTLWRSSGESTLDLANTRFDLVKQGRYMGLRILKADGSVAFDTRLRKGPAKAVKASVDRFLTDTSSAKLVVREGFSGGFFLAMLPFMMLLSLGPVWGLGGRLLVTATPGKLSVVRKRWLLPGVERTLRLGEDEIPKLEVQRLTARKYRNQGVLSGTAAGATAVLASTAEFAILERVQRDLEAYLARS